MVSIPEPIGQIQAIPGTIVNLSRSVHKVLPLPPPPPPPGRVINRPKRLSSPAWGGFHVTGSPIATPRYARAALERTCPPAPELGKLPSRPASRPKRSALRRAGCFQPRFHERGCA